MLVFSTREEAKKINPLSSRIGEEGAGGVEVEF
jgi:hypothetical protein